MRTDITRRQYQVIQGLMNGYNDADIAKDMGCATDTVKKHIATIANKFGIKNKSAHRVLIAVRCYRISKDFKQQECNVYLSPMEHRYIQLVREGHTIKNTAKLLNRTENTVKHAMALMYERVGVESKLGLVLWYESRFPRPVAEVMGTDHCSRCGQEVRPGTEMTLALKGVAECRL